MGNQPPSSIQGKDGPIVLGEHIKGTKLKLTSMGINSVQPSAFNQYLALQKIDLSDNNICSLPQGLFHSLTHLTKLNLTRNPLKRLSLSDILPSLTTLVDLKIEYCRLGWLDDNLFLTLTNLECLKMQDNDLKSLPHSLSALTRLEQLWVNDNHINTLPPSLFDSLTNLKSLYVLIA